MQNEIPSVVVTSDLREQEVSLVPAQREQLSKLLTKSNFFRELDPRVQTKLPEIAQCASKPSGSVVFRQGDTGLHCYVVLSGKVGVWIAAADGNKEEDEDLDEASTKSPSSRSANSAATISTAASETPFTSSDSSENGFSREGSKQAPGENGVSDDAVANTGKRGSLAPLVANAMLARRSSVTRRHSITSLGSGGQSDPNAANPRTVVRRNSLTLLPKLEDCGTRRKTLGKLDLEHLQVEQDFNTVFGNQVATLGPGSIFGELALLHEQPRNATITCSEDCELIIIKKEDFNALLKQEIKRAKEEKMNFLQAHCPGCRRLSALRARKVNTVMYSFEKTTVPKGHVFFKQDSVSPVGVYLVSSGSVELRSKNADLSSPGLYKPKTCNLSVLLKGAAFGCPLPGMPETFTAVATSPCEVYYATGTHFLRLPRSIQQAIQDNLIETMLWRVENSRHDAPPTSSNSSPATPTSSRPSTPTRPRPQSGHRPCTPTRPRPQSGHRPCMASERDMIVPVSRLSGSRPGTPTRPWALVPPSPSFDVNESPSRSSIVSRTRSMVAESRLSRSSSVPFDWNHSRNSQSRVTRTGVLRDFSSSPPVSETPLKRQSSDATFTKEGGHAFNLAMERCKAFGGHRLRAVRKNLGVPSLIDHVNSFRH